MEWVSVKDGMPEPEQEVFYYLDLTGVSKGKYWKNRTTLEDEEINMDCFGGVSGWLCDDVTHWMPYKEGAPLPKPPTGE